MATASGEPNQISSPEELAKWLSDKPPAWAQVIAMRMALRVLPFITAVPRGGDPDDDLALLPRIGAAVLAWTGAAYPEWLDRIALTATEVASHADPTMDNWRGGIAYASAMANVSACAAVYVLSAPDKAHKSIVDRAISTATFAFESYSSAFGQATQPIGFWSQVRQDTLELESSGDTASLARSRLWTLRTPQRWLDIADGFRAYLRRREAGLSIWGEWYGSRVRGHPSYRLDSVRAESIDQRIGSQAAEWWRRDPQEVAIETNAWLNQIRSASSPTSTTRHEADTPNSFIHDDVDGTVDYLGRSKLAFVLAGRLNQIWDDLAAGNGHGRPLPGHERDPKPGFVVHVDAPWGGGKTSFVRYLTRILNPYRHAGTPPDWLRELPMADPDYWPEGYRRPWRIVWFNAWQREHVSPPWWVFYETIRKQITHAAVTEIEAVKPAPGLPESEPPKPDVPAPVGKDYRYASGFGRWARGPEGWLGEMWWRLQRPAILVSAGVAILSVAIIWVMSLFGLSTVVFDGGLPKFEFKDNPFGLLLLLFTGAGAVTTIVTALTRSLFPGTPDAATNYSLGSGDPHEHFRRHFARRMKGARLPVLVVVDDLDRCQPDYVVEMIRGMQTILQSERVVFILLGDRDWIEHSFAGAFKAMNGIDVGPEHSFGGRFVEKAIQLSLMLPDIDPEVRRDYVNALIDIEQPEEPEGGAELRADGVDLNALTASFVAQSQAALRNDDIRERDTQIAAARAPLEAFKADAKVAAAIRQVSTQRALRSAGDKTLEKVTKVRLAGLADYLPANPRQIKRIINAISLWQQVALMEADMEPGEAEWQKLVRWIVIMVEWPKSWFTLSHYPDLVTLVYTPQAETEGLELPEKATEIARLIRETDNVRDLLDLKRPGPGWSHTRIEKTDVDLFKRILPPTSGSFLAPAGDGDAGDAKQDRDGQTGHKGES